MTKQEREKQIKAKYSEPTPKDNHTHTLQTIHIPNKSMPSSRTQYETLPSPNINKMHARRDYDKTRKEASSQSKIFDTYTKDSLHTMPTIKKQLRIKKNQCHPDARNTIP